MFRFHKLLFTTFMAALAGCKTSVSSNPLMESAGNFAQKNTGLIENKINSYLLKNKEIDSIYIVSSDDFPISSFQQVENTRRNFTDSTVDENQNDSSTLIEKLSIGMICVPPPFMKFLDYSGAEMDPKGNIFSQYYFAFALMFFLGLILFGFNWIWSNKKEKKLKKAK